MVLPGSGFFGNPYLAFNGMHYAYNLDLRTEPYANLYQKPSSIMNMTVLTDDRVHGETIGPRKRIAMACGRCRKRKIRCSGDRGDGQPCTNCTNSNHSPCQFLRVNSCETHYRNDFNYNLEVSRNSHARANVMPLPSQIDDRVHPAIYTPSPLNCPRSSSETTNIEYNLCPNTPSGGTYTHTSSVSANRNSRPWNPEQEPASTEIQYNLSPNTPGVEQNLSPNTPAVEQNLSPNTPVVEQNLSPNTPVVEYNLFPNAPGVDTYLLPYRPSPGQPPRIDENTIYLGTPLPSAPASYTYTRSPHTSTLAFRPAPIVNIGGPNGPGTYPILNAMPGDMNRRASTTRQTRHHRPASERRPRPSSGTVYGTSSPTTGFGRASQPSPRSHHSPSPMPDSSNTYGPFVSSPTPSSTGSTIPNNVEIKLDMEGTPGSSQQSTTRHTGVPSIEYRYGDTTQYRQSASPYDHGIVPISHVLPSQAAVEGTRPVQPHTGASTSAKAALSPAGSHS